VREVIEELVAAGKAAVRPGDVCSALRDMGLPMGTWEVRAEFTRLEEAGVIVIDPATATWSLHRPAGDARAAGG
jgi:hypothetical protein